MRIYESLFFIFYFFTSFCVVVRVSGMGATKMAMESILRLEVGCLRPERVGVDGRPGDGGGGSVGCWKALGDSARRRILCSLSRGCWNAESCLVCSPDASSSLRTLSVLLSVLVVLLLLFRVWSILARSHSRSSFLSFFLSFFCELFVFSLFFVGLLFFVIFIKLKKDLMTF